MHKLLIVVLFMSGVTMAEEYPDSYDTVEEKYQLFGIGSLSEKEKAIVSIWWLEAEVNNGGFHQYFWNSEGNNANVALESLYKIGAIKTANLLEQAIDVSFSGSLPLSREARRAQLETNEEYKIAALGELNSSFLEYNEDFHKMLNAYEMK